MSKLFTKEEDLEAPPHPRPILMKQSSSILPGAWTLKENLKPDTVIEGKCSVFRAAYNYLQITVGCGILGLPRAMISLGGVLGIPLLLIACTLNIWAMKTVIRWKEKTGLHTYEQITEHALGSFGYWVPNIAVWVLLCCVIPMLMDIVVQFLFPLLHYIGHGAFAEMDSLFTRLFITGLTIALYPILFLKDISGLSGVSVMGFSCLFFLLILTTIVAGMYHTEKSGTPGADMTLWNSFPAQELGFFKAMENIGIILMCYLSIFCIADIHESLEDKTQMDKVIYIGVSVPLVAYFWMIVAVYIFMHDLELKALLNGETGFYTSSFKEINTKTLLIAIAGCFESFTMALRIPILHFLWRKRSFDMYCTVLGKSPDEKQEEMPGWFFYGHTFWLCISCLVAIFFSNVLAYISFIGALIGGTMMLIFPSLLTMIENGGIKHNLSFGFFKPDNEKENSKTRMRKVFGMIALNFGVYVGIVFVVDSFHTLVTSFL